MKKIIVLISVFFFFLTVFSGCNKSNSDKKTDSLATKYAKFRTSVYKDSGLKTYSSAVEKGEPVDLLSEETVKQNKKDIKLSRIKLSDDTIAYIPSDLLAVKPVVFIEKNCKVYNRNNINSGEFAVIPVGTVAFVIDEKADWLQIDAGKVGDKTVVGKWVKGGITDNLEIVADAVALEKSKAILSEASKGNKDEALALIKSLADKQNQIGALAKEELSKIDGGAAEQKPETGQNPQ